MINSSHGIFNVIPRVQREVGTEFSCKTLTSHIQMFSKTANDYNKLRKWLEENKTGHYSFQFQSEKNTSLYYKRHSTIRKSKWSTKHT